MTNRIYRLILGMIMLIALYFDLKYVAYLLIFMMIFEGVTNFRLTMIVNKLRGIPSDMDINSASNCRIKVEAERIWRLMIGFAFLISYVIFPEQLWVVPWFLAFVIFGAGASDVCPGLLAMKKAGFR